MSFLPDLKSSAAFAGFVPLFVVDRFRGEVIVADLRGELNLDGDESFDFEL